MSELYLKKLRKPTHFSCNGDGVIGSGGGNGMWYYTFILHISIQLRCVVVIVIIVLAFNCNVITG